MRNLLLLILIFSISINSFGQELSDRILLDRVPISVIKQNNISSIDYGRFVEKFDKHGNLIHERFDSWGCCIWILHEYSNDSILLNSFHTFQKDTFEIRNYNYSPAKQLRSIDVTYFDRVTNETTYDTLEFYYNSKNQLIKYSGAETIESYSYDSTGNLIEIQIKMKPGMFGCGNTIHKWTGEYDENNRLSRATTYSMVKTLYEYSYDSKNDSVSILITEFAGIYTAERKEIKYYVNGLPVKVEYFGADGSLKNSEVVTYEYHK